METGIVGADDSLSTLPTPALVLDRSRLRHNIRRMDRHLSGFGVSLRPHMKTAKSLCVLDELANRGTIAATVSTLHEAEMFFAAGVRDILYAVGIEPSKLVPAMALIARGADLTIVLDSADMARHAAGFRDPAGLGFKVLIEIDSDGHRAGVAPRSEELLRIAGILHAGPGSRLAGVMTHAGGSYFCSGAEQIAAHAAKEHAAITTAAARLHAAGLPCPIVSMGSTPTALYAERLDGVTEVRAGVYMFQDLVMAGIGVCRVDAIALSVLTSVIGHRREAGLVIVDAGWMALSRDRGTVQQAVDQGYGVVCGLDGSAVADAIVVSASQEHGVIGRRDGRPLDPAEFPLGSRLRILPNHACATASQHDAYHVVDGGTAVAARWPRFRGW